MKIGHKQALQLLNANDGDVVDNLYRRIETVATKEGHWITRKNIFENIYGGFWAIDWNYDTLGAEGEYFTAWYHDGVTATKMRKVIVETYVEDE